MATVPDFTGLPIASLFAAALPVGHRRARHAGALKSSQNRELL
jgi:hypothetical protein